MAKPSNPQTLKLPDHQKHPNPETLEPNLHNLQYPRTRELKTLESYNPQKLKQKSQEPKTLNPKPQSQTLKP